MSVFLKDKFHESGMTIGELADLLNVSFPTAWRWVARNSVPHPNTLAQLIELGFATSDVPLEELSPREHRLKVLVQDLTRERDEALQEVRRLRDLLGRPNVFCGGGLVTDRDPSIAASGSASMDDAGVKVLLEGPKHGES